MEEQNIVKVEKSFFEHLPERGIVKHAILKRYLQSYFPIMINGLYRNIIYIDGFSGPGSYKNGRDGSPVLAFKSALFHNGKSKRKLSWRIHLIFIEKDKDTCEQLNRKLNKIKQEMLNGLNQNAIDRLYGNFTRVTYEVINDEFANAIIHILENDEYKITKSTPILAFVDPFGYKSIPMDVMRKLMNASNKTEVFVNIMYGAVNRLFNLDSTAGPINRLLGTSQGEWRSILLAEGLTSDERRFEFVKYYYRQLPEGMNRKLLQLNFGMRRTTNRFIYYLSYFTTHRKGVETMKSSMWKHNQKEDEFLFSEFYALKGHQPIYQNERHKIESRVKDSVLQNFKDFANPIKGSVILDFILLNTIYNINVSNTLKKALKHYRVNYDSKVLAFKDMEYNFHENRNSSNSGSTKAANIVKKIPKLGNRRNVKSSPRKTKTDSKIIPKRNKATTSRSVRKQKVDKVQNNDTTICSTNLKQSTLPTYFRPKVNGTN